MQLIQNEFQEYELTEDEVLRCSIFNDEQLMYIGNMRAVAARTLLSLSGTRKDYDAYLDQHIHLKGQLATLDLLISNHHQAIETMRELASQQRHE